MFKISGEAEMRAHTDTSPVVMSDQARFQLFGIDDGDGTEDRDQGVSLPMAVLESYAVLNEHQSRQWPAILGCRQEWRK